MTCSSQEVAGAIRQLIVEIDCRLIQNPAYGLLILIKQAKQSVCADCFFICCLQRPKYSYMGVLQPVFSPQIAEQYGFAGRDMIYSVHITDFGRIL